MNLRLNPIACCIMSILACSLLAACGGGGGGGMVRPTVAVPPPPLPPAPPPPPPPSGEPCPAPITGPCVIQGNTSHLTFTEYGMRGGRQSDDKLFVHGGNSGGGYVNLEGGEYRFSGGTEIAGTTLVVWDRLVSDVVIAHDYTGTGFMGTSELWLLGSVRGNVLNDEHLNLRCWSGLHSCASVAQQRIDGNYTQLAQGVLQTTLGRHLDVSGSAKLEGSLLLVKGDAGYVLPTAPSSVLVLHADGAVVGQFREWSASGLFIAGALRYTSNDVFFDATRISLQAVTAANGIGNQLTLMSAANLDRALLAADGYSSHATAAQQQFLQTASHIVWLEDLEQARRSLDSLYGAAHADAMLATLQQGIGDAFTRQRLAALQPGIAAGAWSSVGASGSTSGFDQWLSPRLLVGVQAGQGSDDLRDTFGQSTGLSPQAGAYLRWFGDDGWYAGGSVGYAQHKFVLDRTLDLGRGGQWNAHSRHRFNVAGVQGEAGRRVALAGGTLTPYLALDATALRSERAIEQGGTGFELALQPAMRAQLGAGFGLLYGREWRLGDTGWLRLDVDARVQRQLADAGDPLRAAFLGVPDLWFELPGNAPTSSGWLDVGLQGGFAQAWRWSFDLARPWAGPRAGVAARLGVQRSF